MNNSEINHLVAEKVMGWNLKQMEHCSAWIDDQNGWVLKQMWKPSTNIQDAWLVVEKLRESGLMLDVFTYKDKYNADISKKNSVMTLAEADAETAQMAICLTALKIKGIEI